MSSEHEQDSTGVHIEDGLASVVDAHGQRAAAERAQYAFTRAFRLSAEAEDDDSRARQLAAIAEELEQWVKEGNGREAQALRRALLLNGLDQWGLAWSQAFGLLSIAGLSTLIASLRHAPDAQDEALFLRQYEAIDAAESNVIDFKLELRRAIHLALWYSSIAADNAEEGLRLAAVLGSLLLALARQMPELGWRLVADSLAFIQIRCLSEGLASTGIGQQATEALLQALARELPAAQRSQVMDHAANAVLAWQRRARGSRH